MKHRLATIVICGLVGSATAYAETALEAAVRKEPTNHAAWGELGIEYLDAGEPDRAIVALRRSLALRDDPRGHHAMSRALEAKGDLKGAFASCERSRALLDSPQANACLGRLLGQSGKVVEALKYFRRAVALDGKNAERHYQLGTAYALAKRYREAAATLVEATRLAPDHHAAHYHLGLVYVELGDLPNALLRIRRAAELGDPAARAMLDAMAKDLAREQQRGSGGSE